MWYLQLQAMCLVAVLLLLLGLGAHYLGQLSLSAGRQQRLQWRRGTQAHQRLLICGGGGMGCVLLGLCGGSWLVTNQLWWWWWQLGEPAACTLLLGLSGLAVLGAEALWRREL